MAITISCTLIHYSVLKLFTGFAMAALIARELTVPGAPGITYLNQRTFSKTLPRTFVLILRSL